MQPLISNRGRRAFFPAVIFCLTGLCFASSCKKEEDTARVLNTRDKLLGTWQRNLRAYDYNQNKVLDSADILHAPATDTLILTLVPDASYTRTQRFKGVDFSENGTWHLQRSDQEIVLQSTTSTTRIDTLTLDTVAQDYFRYSTDSGTVKTWGAFIRPR